MAVKALANGVRMSPRKVAVVAALVRGRTVEDALVILSHVPRISAGPLIKVIESAKANADYNHNYRADTLKIIEISVTPGGSLKRFRPAARGRANPFQRRSCHIRVIVDGEMRAPKKAAVATPKATAKETK
jgi:large subunit ribosomal protein L22